MDKRFLITFGIDDRTDFWWCDNEEEFRERILILKSSKSVEILDAIEILNCVDINIDDITK